MDVFLVRHGEAAATWTEAEDPGLSPLGHRQASAAAEELAALLSSRFNLVSSPLRRARETAAALASRLETDVRVVQAFQEIPAPVPMSERQQWLQGIMNLRWQDIESGIGDWRSGIFRNLERLKQPSVIFTHFMVINAIVSELSGKQEIVCCLPDNASITHVRKTDGGFQLVALGRQIATHVN